MSLARIDLADRLQQVEGARLVTLSGRVERVLGLAVESIGPPVAVGEEVQLLSGGGQICPGEVVGFSGNRVKATTLNNPAGIRPGDRLVALGRRPALKVGASMLGRVLDATGRALDRRPVPRFEKDVPLHAVPPDPMSRRPIDQKFVTGVRSIDGLVACGVGQRLGIFAGSGVGKSSLLGMMARHASADVNVIALVGERGREVREFIDNDLGDAGRKHSVVFVSTSDEPALRRIRAAQAATATAEFFRDRGAHVLLMMDSLTRVAMAQREIGLAAGEPPSAKGYTPSVFSLLPRLVERAGNAATGSITAFYTVLVEGDDLNDPVADAARSLLDGHVVLSREMASRGHYPAVDVLGSVSRLMDRVTEPDHRRVAKEARRLLATWRDAEDLIAVGAYSAGSSARIDAAVAAREPLEAFLIQPVNDPSTWDETVAGLAAAAATRAAVDATSTAPPELAGSGA
ncbi:MAG: FliI/YscN family ATPase [Acidobacteriota bacterium]